MTGKNSAQADLDGLDDIHRPPAHVLERAVDNARLGHRA